MLSWKNFPCISTFLKEQGWELGAFCECLSQAEENLSEKWYIHKIRKKERLTGPHEWPRKQSHTPLIRSKGPVRWAIRWVTHEQRPPTFLRIAGSHSLIAQLVKNPPAKQETLVWFLGLEDPLEKRTTTHSSILVWRILWIEEPSRLYSPWSHRVRHD